MFGRRSSGSGKGKASDIPRHPGPDADGVSRVISKEVWEGPQGDFLREIGVSPDDPSNLMPTQEGIQARFDKLREELDAFVTGLNTQLPEGVKVTPWAMIPWNVWQQQHGDFLLITCELYPVAPWNQLLLPEDQHGSMVLGLPQPLPGTPPGLEEAANKGIEEIRKDLMDVHARTAAALDRGDDAGLLEFAKAKSEAWKHVVGLAHALGAQTYGVEAYHRHKELFGATLGWSAAKQ